MSNLRADVIDAAWNVVLLMHLNISEVFRKKF